SYLDIQLLLRVCGAHDPRACAAHAVARIRTLGKGVPMRERVRTRDASLRTPAPAPAPARSLPPDRSAPDRAGAGAGAGARLLRVITPSAGHTAYSWWRRCDTSARSAWRYAPGFR